jgi:hypothetical protein
MDNNVRKNTGYSFAEVVASVREASGRVAQVSANGKQELFPAGKRFATNVKIYLMKYKPIFN